MQFKTHCTYDYNNVWIRKTLDSNGDGTADSKSIFIPENYQTTVQLDDTNLTDANGPAVTHHYLWTPNAQDKLLADITSSEILWSLTDHLGTIRDVVGNSTTHLIYDAFGNLISGTNPILFGYTGKPFDTDTQLQNNINRWYDATVGRWLSTDPISFEGDDTNLYRYVGNSLITYVDLSGTEKRRKPMDPNQANVKKQGREGKNKARASDKWKPHNNTPPSQTPHHTPGRDHRKQKSKRKGSANIKIINGIGGVGGELACIAVYTSCLDKANRNYEANLQAAYMMTDPNLRENSIQLANRIHALDLTECATTYAACGLSCLLPFDIF